jgi:hypothetical protein
MQRNKELMQRRNADIRKDYDAMRKRLKFEFVIYKLSEKYYLSTGTIEHILFRKA